MSTARAASSRTGSGTAVASATGGGMYRLVPSVLAAIVFGLINVWVLPAETLR